MGSPSPTSRVCRVVVFDMAICIVVVDENEGTVLRENKGELIGGLIRLIDSSLRQDSFNIKVCEINISSFRSNPQICFEHSQNYCDKFGQDGVNVAL